MNSLKHPFSSSLSTLFPEHSVQRSNAEHSVQSSMTSEQAESTKKTEQLPDLVHYFFAMREEESVQSETEGLCLLSFLVRKFENIHQEGYSIKFIPKVVSITSKISPIHQVQPKSEEEKKWDQILYYIQK